MTNTQVLIDGIWQIVHEAEDRFKFKSGDHLYLRVDQVMAKVEAVMAALSVHNTPAEWAMVDATLDAYEHGVTTEELREAARVAVMSVE